MLEALWWGGFTVLGVWAQYFFPGVDFYAPGLILCLQEGRPRLALWLAVIWILILEGSGSLAFGYGVLWCVGLFLLYAAGRWVFHAKNLLFMCLLGLCMGLWHYLLILGLAELESIDVPMVRLLWDGVWQAVVFPLEWLLLNRFYPERLRNVSAL
jgi:hypothetical protein